MSKIRQTPAKPESTGPESTGPESTSTGSTEAEPTDVTPLPSEASRSPSPRKTPRPVSDTGPADTVETASDATAPEVPLAQTANAFLGEMVVNPIIVFQGGLFLLAVLATFYVAQAVVLPIVLALVLKLLFQPLMRQADRLHIPRFLSALVITVLLIASLAAILAALSGSAGTWFAQLPQGISRVEQKLSFLHGPFDMLRNLSDTIDRLLGGNSADATTTQPAAAHHLSLPDTLLAGTGTILDLSFSTFLLMFFLLAAGDTFLRRLVEILPRFRDKRQAVDISLQIERDIGSYLLTVTGMNALFGLATALAMYLCGLRDPVLWGVMAFVLNYVPILGPITGFCLFALIGFMSFDTVLAASMPAAIYLALHVIEGEIVTPNLLAKRLTLNPALIVMSLIFWYWLWGVAGAFLAVPLLAITKIVCSRFRPLMAFGHFLGGTS